MICIVEIENGDVTGWIIATDTDDARRQAQGAGLNDLASILYTMPPMFRAGKYPLPTGHLMLVS